jgi:hypothetical protein
MNLIPRSAIAGLNVIDNVLREIGLLGRTKLHLRCLADATSHNVVSRNEFAQIHIERVVQVVRIDGSVSRCPIR